VRTEDSSIAKNIPLPTNRFIINRNSDNTADKCHPGPHSFFPLGRDHELLYLVAMNVSRAVLTNWNIISSAAGVFTNSSSCAGDITANITLSADSTVDMLSLPKSLHPTHLQLSTRHPFW